MNPENHRQVFGVFWSVNIEDLPFHGRVGVGNVLFHILRPGHSQKGGGEQERGEAIHGGTSQINKESRV